MNELWIINALLGFIMLGLSTAVGNLYSRLKDMQDELSHLHTTYAKKEDVNNDFGIIRASLQRIEEKLDRKVDRG